MESQPTLVEAVKALGIGLKVKHTGQAIQDNHTVYTYKVTLTHGDKQATFSFFRGLGCKGEEPTVADVVYCLASDSSACGMSFEEFASDFGYDSDSRKAEGIYRACKRNAKKLIGLLGSEAVNHLATLEH